LSVVRDTDEYLQQQDDFANWLDDCAELQPGTTVGETTTLLFASWRTWAEARNLRAGREPELLGKLQAPPYNCRFSRRVKTKGPNGEDQYARGVEGIRLLIHAPATAGVGVAPEDERF
jgi:hypothetical protein